MAHINPPDDFDLDHPDAPASFESDALYSEPGYWLNKWANT